MNMTFPRQPKLSNSDRPWSDGQNKAFQSNDCISDNIHRRPTSRLGGIQLTTSRKAMHIATSSKQYVTRPKKIPKTMRTNATNQW